MSVDKLVDSTQLDSDLTSVANAIRTKGGTSASLSFPAGFVSAVEAIPTGGGTMQSGTLTNASDTKSLTFPLSGAVTNFVFWDSEFPVGGASDGWHCIGGGVFNGAGVDLIRYNNANTIADFDRTFTITDSSITISVRYNALAGKTFYWYGW